MAQSEFSGYFHLKLFLIFLLILLSEFWKQIPPNEPYRVILGDVRDKLYNTRERARQLLANGTSDIPEEVAFTNVEQVYYNKSTLLIFHLKH